MVKIQDNINVCSEVLENTEFEFRSAQLYSDFLVDFAKLIRCKEEMDEKEYPISSIDMKTIQTLKDKFNLCLDDLDSNNK